MNKKFYSLFFLLTLPLSSCGMASFFNGGKGEKEVNEINFNITSASFIDAEGHLKVNYTCNYSSPFSVEEHPFARLNITGVASKELDHSNSGYFTVLSSVVSTNLKFEFYDTNGLVYISTRYQNVVLFEEDPAVNPDDPVVNPDDPVIDPIDYPEGYETLYWSDEFDGDKLDKGNWTYEIGNGSYGWGNNESEYYTDHNETVKDGKLIISAKRETIGGFAYTSTRIKTQNKVHFTYGYIEARIALPNVTGMWPAFWMMPNDSFYGGWPHSGEIDIMEAKGRIANQSSSALHFSRLNGAHDYVANEKNGHNITEYHKYAVEWKEDTIRYFIDDVCHFSVDKNMWSTSGASTSLTAPFDKDFYIILNLAVGGHFDGYQLPPSDFESADMKVDYVRVFK